jgi:hypothetical protein
VRLARDVVPAPRIDAERRENAARAIQYLAPLLRIGAGGRPATAPVGRFRMGWT